VHITRICTSKMGTPYTYNNTVHRVYAELAAKSDMYNRYAYNNIIKYNIVFVCYVLLLQLNYSSGRRRGGKENPRSDGRTQNIIYENV